ncbi:type I-E CRISPR-associated protein Cse1/CasA [Streptomyces sp. SKN60]|uniref:type I-E CRISPR-associated protein Cse1/CasA n=1 Tax=Streptomyces sp. SKN60 TaxID=2855506 RepID=UPI002246F13A|nr:type I-E CRISPR-associated protein Cse1/CasA [Streptomyces sp. SKN60]MCX2182669.1 type I-E CRISPR-associated protein Cse1/CasA [Streptomyces sp. SKN60]
MAPSFCLATRPWIPLARTTDRMVGLRSLFHHAHEIEDLALPIPPAESSLWRLLAAITARLTTLDQPDMPVSDWHEQRARLLVAKGGFDREAVDTYLSMFTWDLFDTKRPFLQDPSLAGQCREAAGVNALVHGRPAGNNLAWFSVHTDTHPRPVTSHEAAWHLLVHHYYGRSGRCSARTVDTVTEASLRAGPIRGTVSFHPRGRTLYESMLLHLTPYRGPGQSEPDRCPWEEPAPRDPLAPPAAVTWPGGILTGRSRHAVLLVPDADGSHVTNAYLTWATLQSGLPATDPYLIIRTDPKKPAETRDMPQRADTDRAVWLDLDTLVLAGDETSTARRPEVFSSLNDLPADVVTHLQVRVLGFDQEAKTNNRAWYSALTPPIWTWAQEKDPLMAARIAECRLAAETVAAVLARAATRAWREATLPNAGSSKPPHRGTEHQPLWTRQALAAYWPRAETVFWNLINHHPDRPAFPAFAYEAVDSLRTAAGPALPRQRGAGPALARAVVTLRETAAPRPKDRR